MTLKKVDKACVRSEAALLCGAAAEQTGLVCSEQRLLPEQEGSDRAVRWLSIILVAVC